MNRQDKEFLLRLCELSLWVVGLLFLVWYLALCVL